MLAARGASATIAFSISSGTRFFSVGFFATARTAAAVLIVGSVLIRLHRRNCSLHCKAAY